MGGGVFFINFSRHFCSKKKDITSCLDKVEISQPFLSRIVVTKATKNVADAYHPKYVLNIA